jgi:hypothetical protein
LNKTPERHSNFISDGGNSLLALTFTEQIKQSYSAIDTNYLFDLILHKDFGDLIEYIANPQQQQKSDEYFVNMLPVNSVIKSNLNPIWSIQRCSKIFLHNENHLMVQYSKELTFSPSRLILHWKHSMMKCIDASPLIVLLDDYREYVIIGSHAGLINAYQINNGQLIWSFQAKDRIEGSGTISRNGEFVLIGK